MKSASPAIASHSPARPGRRLPDFIGVGLPRTGTSWLDAILRGHVGLPRNIKEVDFFVKNYARGIEWYKSYFSECDPRFPVGEICPSYLGSDEARERIARHIPHCRIICTFRDPVHILFSFWKLARRNAWTDSDFESYVPADWATGGQGLRGWRETFGTDHVLAQLYEDLLEDPQGYLDRVCDFIGINRIAIAGSLSATERINSFSHLPRRYYLARKGRKLRDWLRTRERFRTIDLLKSVGVWRLCFEGGPPFPTLDPATETRVRRRLLPAIEALEKVIGRDLSAWKSPSHDAPRQRAGSGG
jgi:Sulfotransferase domain